MKAYYKNNRNKLIAFKGNHKAVKIIDNIGYKEESISGNPCIYNSEYKQNLINLTLKGNTIQQTYEGYNLAYCSTDNDYLYRAKSEILSNNSFRVKTTNTDGTRFVTYNIPVTPKTKVIVSFNFNRNYNVETRSKFWADNSITSSSGTLVGVSSFSTKTEGSVSSKITTGNTNYLGITIYLSEGKEIPIDAEILITDLMVTYGEERKVFEPYVGGIPSPNPGAPIKSIYETDLVIPDTYADNFPLLIATTPITLLSGSNYKLTPVSVATGYTIAVFNSLDDTGQFLMSTDGEIYDVTVPNVFYIGIAYPYSSQDVPADEVWSILKDLTITATSVDAVTVGITKAYPQAIQNTGDNSIDVKLSGANLFDIETVFATMDTTVPEVKLAWEKQADGSWYCFNNGLVQYKRLWDNTLNVSGEITLSVVQRGRKTEDLYYLYYTIYYTDGTSINLRPKIKGEFEEYSITTSKDKTVSHINLRATNTERAWVKQIMINYGQYEAYLPYYERLVNIPSEVTLTDGTVVPLRFAKLGTVNNVAINKADTLKVERGKVTYTQYLDLYQPKEPYVWTIYTGAVEWGARVGIYFNTLAKQKSARKRGICSHGGNVGNYWSPLDVWVGVDNQVVFWLGIIDYLGINNNWANKTSPTNAEKTEAISQMNNYFATQEANGTPFQVLYELPKPIEYDLTNTDLGQQLLALAEATQNQTNIIKATSEIPISEQTIIFAKWKGQFNE